MKPEALDAIGVDDSTEEPVGIMEGVAKTKVTLKDILLERTDEGTLYIGKAKALTG